MPADLHWQYSFIDRSPFWRKQIRRLGLIGDKQAKSGGQPQDDYAF